MSQDAGDSSILTDSKMSNLSHLWELFGRSRLDLKDSHMSNPPLLKDSKVYATLSHGIRSCRQLCERTEPRGRDLNNMFYILGYRWRLQKCSLLFYTYLLVWFPRNSSQSTAQCLQFQKPKLNISYYIIFVNYNYVKLYFFYLCIFVKDEST